jgi:hypothetical protein
MRRGFEEERLGALPSTLRPTPQGWVQAAKELPVARGSFDEIVARAEADLAFRDALIADLEEALDQAGYEPDRRMVSWLEERLGSSPDH